MLGENDGPSMIAYASDGAQYGLGFFVPFIPVLFAMAYVCQEMCMRVGAVTHRGYGELVLQRYGRVWGWFGAGDLTLTNLVTLVAEFVSIRVGLAYFHLGAGVAVALGLVLVRVHAQRRALLALGAHRARPGALQRAVPGGGDPRQTARRSARRARSTSARSPAAASTRCCCCSPPRSARR